MVNQSTKPPYYSDYLRLDEILSCQHPKSFLSTNRADDEMLFIIVHQTFELWFKEIIFEIDRVLSVFTQSTIDDNSPDMSKVVHKLKRVVRILELLNQQIGVLETMTSLDFLEFRHLLVPASGFQSKQFRLIEAKLGLKTESRRDGGYYKHTGPKGFTVDHQREITDVEQHDTLKEATIKWLERMPFFEPEYWTEYVPTYEPGADATHKFWSDYRRIYAESLAEEEREELLGKLVEVFFEKGYQEFSPNAMSAALFIMLYRNLPVFQLPFELLNTVAEIDEVLSTWRYRHLMMVRRIIGDRMGTGGTSGTGYLEAALKKNYIFQELTSITTFLVERSRLPNLPNVLKQKLSFNS